MIALIRYNNLLNHFWIIKCLFLRAMDSLYCNWLRNCIPASAFTWEEAEFVYVRSGEGHLKSDMVLLSYQSMCT